MLNQVQHDNTKIKTYTSALLSVRFLILKNEKTKTLFSFGNYVYNTIVGFCVCRFETV